MRSHDLELGDSDYPVPHSGALPNPSFDILTVHDGRIAPSMEDDDEGGVDRSNPRHLR